MSNIGILGGTFDPIHKGHLELGQKAYEQFKLDQIWFMPSGCPPHKTDHRITEGSRRRDMVLAAIKGIPWFAYSDFEMKRQGNTYTARTLSLLGEAYPEHIFYFIIGADSLYQIEQWFHPEQVMEQTILLGAGRPYGRPHRSLEDQIQYLKEKYGARIYPICFKEMDISSEAIRALAARGGSISRYVPLAVEKYIKSCGLYGIREAAADVKGE